MLVLKLEAINDWRETLSDFDVKFTRSITYESGTMSVNVVELAKEISHNGLARLCLMVDIRCTTAGSGGKADPEKAVASVAATEAICSRGGLRCNAGGQNCI